jgi:SAM-dependent methyltransferase
MSTIAYIGNFTASWCTEVHLAREMRALGHHVQQFQEPHPGEDPHRFLRYVEQWCLENRPLALMFTRTWGLPYEATALWRRLEANGTATMSYHLDLYVGLQREAGILNDPFWRTQYVFTPDGDPDSQRFFQEQGINHYWLSPAVVSDEAVHGNYRPSYDYDVVFVGSYGYHDEWPWRPKLIDYLAATYGRRFKRFGGDVAPGPTRGQDLNDLYASARVVVGDSLHLPGHINYWTDRYFETIGRGGFLIAPAIEGLQQFLTSGEHYVAYEHPNGTFTDEQALDMIRRKVDYALENPEYRQRIKNAGQAHVAANHTYMHRLAEALKIVTLRSAAITINDVNAVAETIYRPAADIERLELGSGTSPTPGFTHLDINPNAPDVDIVGTAWPLELPDQSVGEIRAVDVLEHLSYWDTPAILADWFRVLRPDGRIYIQVPDAETIMEWFVRRPAALTDRLPANLPQTPLAGAAWRLLGGHRDGVYAGDNDDFRWNAHYALFSESSLRKAMMAAGFVDIDIQTNAHPNLLCYARKP